MCESNYVSVKGVIAEKNMQFDTELPRLFMRNSKLLTKQEAESLRKFLRCRREYQGLIEEIPQDLK